MFQRPDGTGVPFHAVPMAPKRRRGRRLTDYQVRRISDLIYYFMTETCGLSPTDAERVLSRRIGKTQRNVRYHRVSSATQKAGIMPLMVEVIKDAG